MDLKWFNTYLLGNSLEGYKHFGAHFKKDEEGNDGVEFLLYAPLAKQVNVLGEFNNFSIYENSLMEKIDYRGLFRLFVKGCKNYQGYKYHILNSENKYIEKSDPYAFFNEMKPSMYSRLFDLAGFIFHDQEFIKNRDRNFSKPMSIYEVHLGSWMKKNNGDNYSYEEIADRLIPYLKGMEFTHVEIMPLTQYPCDASWGYQPTGYFAIDSRYGNPFQLMSLVDRLHQANIGVILDFVPVHFAVDSYGLSRFDGSCMYEYSNENEYSEWGTKNFDLGKDPVRSFLMSSMAYFLDLYHFDGLRLDAVSNVIYWGGNSSRGKNDGGIEFLKRANRLIHQKFNNCMMIAEDSSSYGEVTKGFSKSGLGFDYKWDLGWMNDTLKYYKLDPIYKRYNHNLMTFSMAYFYSENFILPFSHDEVVHMKGSIVNKMFGTYEEKFALVRNLYAYQFAHPGKKLNFMGNEIATFEEWTEKKELNWGMKRFPIHDSISHLFKDLNLIYKNHKAMYVDEYDPKTFRWIKVDDADQSVFVFVREVKEEAMLFVFNMTPNFYPNYRIGVPYLGEYEEIFNSEKACYHGSDQYNGARLIADKNLADHQLNSITIKLASFAACYFVIHKKE